MTPALHLVSERAFPLRHTAERRTLISYKSGHIWRADRAHIDRVLDAKAALQMDATFNGGSNG